ncbi:MAG: hypothetical protein LIP12_15570 [Clostridiales bacterium]|nr:hypothetical protein [Clostridiales bacterium]
MAEWYAAVLYPASGGFPVGCGGVTSVIRCQGMKKTMILQDGFLQTVSSFAVWQFGWSDGQRSSISYLMRQAA